MLAFEALEHRDEALAVGVQVGLAARALDPAPAEHHGVEVTGERDVPEAAGLDEPRQVVVVEVAVGHRHRLAAMAFHCQQRPRVVLGVEQRHLAADELRVLARAAPGAQVGHLPVDLALGVRAVDANPVGLLGVVARRAGQVAAREHAVRALAPGGAPPEHLVGRLDVRGQLLPAPGERLDEVGVLGSGRDLERAEPLAKVHAPTTGGVTPAVHAESFRPGTRSHPCTRRVRIQGVRASEQAFRGWGRSYGAWRGAMRSGS